MRITFGHSFDEGLLAIARASAQLASAQRRVATGKRIEAPSDDPAGSASAISERRTLSAISAYERAGDGVEARLAVADSALSDMVDQLIAAKTTAAAARSSSRGPAELAAYATEILGLRDALFDDINTRFGGAYLFSGAAAVPPYARTLTGFTPYQGGGEGLEVDISEGRSAQVTFKGDVVFQGSDPAHILDALTTLAADVAAGTAAGIDAGLAAISSAFDRVVRAQAEVGISQRTLADVSEQLISGRVGSVARLSTIEDANMAEAISDLNRAQVAQQSSLGSFATLARLTLMDYLQ